MRTDKEIFLARLLRERDKFEWLINRAGSARRMTVKGISGKWSIKDILARILAYEQYLGDRMNELLHNEPYTPCTTQTALDAFLAEFGYPDFGSPLVDDDDLDTWIIEKYRNVALEDLIAQEIQAFDVILTAFEKMPEEMILRHNLYERIADHTYRHYRDHAVVIKRWLRIQSPQTR
ncbi:MAG TPA: hypothetical protein VNK49_02750 [Anaerolineales bacterium]|nr:hypothetical protein [Anaerolineales bacterium]